MAHGLQDVAVGQWARVVGFAHTAGGRAYRQKLLAMGLTPGVVFQVTRVAPMGDPVEINVRGFSLSLRKDEAATLEVELCGGEI
ncbi:MAG: FeoA domain-containing protein [Azovibrio sp.]|nr:FeoA domain-containing protein [Azovibrio sp.]